MIHGASDIDNTLDALSPITLPWEGIVLETNDGSNWRNIVLTDFGLFVDIESFGQSVERVNSVPHTLEFEFTAQKFGPVTRYYGRNIEHLVLDFRIEYFTKQEDFI